MTTTKIRASDLRRLSQEELVQFTKTVQELKQANSFRKLDDYLTTAHEGQLKFHKSQKRIRIVTAGNRGGKSTSGQAEHIWLATGTHPFRKNRVPLKIAVVLPDFANHGVRIFEPKLNEWCPPQYIKKIQRHQGGCIASQEWHTGSRTDVFSHDQADIVFEGSDYDVVFFDEPPPHRIWKAMWRSVVDRGGIMYLMGTPLASEWLFDLARKWKGPEDPLIDIINFSSRMNAKNLGQGDEKLGNERLDEFLSQFSAGERAAREEGQFIAMEGLIFKDFSQSTHLISPFEIPHSWSIIESIDPHPHKPWAVSYTALAPNGAKILVHSLYSQGAIEDVANDILLARAGLPIVDNLKPRLSRTLIDNAASVPTWQRSNTDPTARRISVREELENLIGPKVGGPRVECAPKNVSGKIDLFRRWLVVRDRNGKKRADFYAFDTEAIRQSFVHEIERYSWQKFARQDGELKTQPVKKNDDIMDTVLQVALTLGSGDTDEKQIADFTGGFKGYGNNRGAADFHTR